MLKRWAVQFTSWLQVGISSNGPEESSALALPELVGPIGALCGGDWWPNSARAK
jgi:hypothetical protein